MPGPHCHRRKLEPPLRGTDTAPGSGQRNEQWNVQPIWFVPQQKTASYQAAHAVSDDDQCRHTIVQLDLQHSLRKMVRDQPETCARRVVVDPRLKALPVQTLDQVPEVVRRTVD